MKVLVTGATGQVGGDLVKCLSKRSYIEVLGVGSKEADVSKREEILCLVDEFSPEIIFHCGAMINVDKCEIDKIRAFQINSLGTRYIVEAAQKVGSHVLYVSTDFVFDGEKGSPYFEWDLPNPINTYGLSKLGGEKELRESDSIVRISWVFSEKFPNFVSLVLDLEKKQKTLKFIDDQQSKFSASFDLAPVMVEIGLNRMRGIYHLTNSGVASRYDGATAILEILNKDPNRVIPITHTELDTPAIAKRPRFSALENLSIESLGLGPLPHYRDALERLLKEKV